MMSSSTFRLPNYSYSFQPTSQTGGQPTPEFEPESQVRKLKGSVQLIRWSRARSIRSGQKLDRPITQTKKAPGPSSSVPAGESTLPLSTAELGSDSSDGEDEAQMTAAKSIFMVSDGTGSTAENSVNAALGQFEHCLVDRGCPVNTHLYSGIENIDGLMEIVKKAAKESALLIYTLADPSMADAARQACKLWGIPSTDILGPITEAIASHLSVSPSGLSRWASGRKFPLTDEYFRRIEAIEFTMKQGDGALPRNLHKADIVLAGVSRTGKTPLSIYLAQKGYKVANVPIVMGVELPEALFEVDPKKVFGLTVNHLVLHSIRRTRAKSLGFGKEVRNNYSEIDHVKQELEFARNIFAENPVWPVIEVTGRAIEETASIVLKVYHDRKDMCSMAGISKRY